MSATQKPSTPGARLARLWRAVGDLFLTIGMGKGFSGSGRPTDASATNVMLFGEGRSEDGAAGKAPADDAGEWPAER